jgi:hypothetical protein
MIKVNLNEQFVLSGSVLINLCVFYHCELGLLEKNFYKCCEFLIHRFNNHDKQIHKFWKELFEFTLHCLCIRTLDSNNNWQELAF